MTPCSCTHQVVDKEKTHVFFIIVFIFYFFSWCVHVCWEYVLMWHQEEHCILYVGVFTAAADEVNWGRYCSKDFKSRKVLPLEVIISEIPRLTGCGHTQGETNQATILPLPSEWSDWTTDLISWVFLNSQTVKTRHMNNRLLMAG